MESEELIKKQNKLRTALNIPPVQELKSARSVGRPKNSFKHGIPIQDFKLLKAKVKALKKLRNDILDDIIFDCDQLIKLSAFAERIEGAIGDEKGRIEWE